jgi:hypothetical protein
VNTGYVIWFAVLVVVAGATLLWLAIGVVPEIPPDPGPGTEPGATEDVVLANVTGISEAAKMASEPVPGPGPRPGPRPGPGPRSWPAPELSPGPASEPAGEDGIARPS